MYNTYTLINKMETSSYAGKTIDEVALSYRNATTKLEKDKCFAYIYKHVFPMLLEIHHSPQYSAVSIEERTEESLCCTLYAIEHWKSERGQKLSSYIYMVYKSCLTTLGIRYTTGAKYKANMNIVLGTDEYRDYLMRSIPITDKYQHTFEVIDSIENDKNLTSDDVKFCKALLAGYKTIKETSKVLPITSITKYDKKNKKYQTIPIVNTIEKERYCNKIRNNLRKKILDGKVNLFEKKF